MAAVAPDRRQRTRRDLGLEQLLATRHARERRLRRRRRSVLSIVALLGRGDRRSCPCHRSAHRPDHPFEARSLDDLRPLSLGENSFLYTDNGRLLGVVPSATNRQTIGLAKISPWLRNATVAIEDARFWDHGALDYQGIARAFYEDLTSGKIEQGGSTLTQQLVRNLYIGNQEKTLSRKIKEACLADKFFSNMQHIYGRDAQKQILSAYLNQVFYGHHAYGVEAASKTYFSRRASQLNLAQAALLAGLPQAPTTYDPIVSPTSPSRGVTRYSRRCQERLHHARGVPKAGANGSGSGRATSIRAPAAELLRLGDAAACRPLRPASGRARRAESDDDPRSSVAGARAPRGPVRAPHLDRPRDGHRRDRPEHRCGQGDGGLPPERQAAPVQPRDAGTPLDRQRVQADHTRDRAQRRRLALLVVLRPTGALHHRPAMPDGQRPVGRPQLRRRVSRDMDLIHATGAPSIRSSPSSLRGQGSGAS